MSQALKQSPANVDTSNPLDLLDTPSKELNARMDALLRQGKDAGGREIDAIALVLAAREVAANNAKAVECIAPQLDKLDQLRIWLSDAVQEQNVPAMQLIEDTLGQVIEDMRGHQAHAALYPNRQKKAA